MGILRWFLSKSTHPFGTFRCSVLEGKLEVPRQIPGKKEFEFSLKRVWPEMA